MIYYLDRDGLVMSVFVSYISLVIYDITIIPRDYCVPYYYFFLLFLSNLLIILRKRTMKRHLVVTKLDESRKNPYCLESENVRMKLLMRHWGNLWIIRSCNSSVIVHTKMCICWITIHNLGVYFSNSIREAPCNSNSDSSISSSSFGDGGVVLISKSK